MQQNDFDKFCELLGSISEQYGKPISEGAKIIYWQGLSDFDFIAVQEALFRHIRNPDNGMFMPKIADIIRMLQGSTQDSALSAWAKVDQAVRKVGTYSSVVFDDSLIHKVLNDMGGWLSLGQKSNDEWPFVAKEFETRYRGFKARNEVGIYPRVMLGLFDATNSAKGYEVKPPVLIGIKDNAVKVMNGGSDKPALQFIEANTSTFKPILSLINTVKQK